MSTYRIWTVLTILILFDVLIFVTLENQSHQNTLPSFLTQTKSGYMITYDSGNCVQVLTLHQEKGGIWVEDGHHECPTAASNSTSSHAAQTPNFFEKACYSVLANDAGAQIGFKSGLDSYKDTNNTQNITYIGVIC